MNGIDAVIANRAGLFRKDESNRDPVPLEGVKVHAEVFGHGSRVTLTQRFRNTEKVPVEAVYVFPLPEAAAVCGMTMRVGDRVVVGDVEEREKAFDRYDDALAAGYGAALLDVERPNVFTISVGNILPGQAVAIELQWVAELPLEGEAIRFVLPTTVAPRYAPAEDTRGVSPTPAERVSPPVDLEVPYGLELDVDVALPCPVRAVDSPSHPVRVELDGSRARVTLSHGVAAMDRDFVLLVTPREAGRPQVLIERNDDGLVTAALSFAPVFESAAAPKEVIFLVDRSGSMAGDSIEQVRAALHLCLRSLRDGDRFNIVGFGSTFSALFPESAAYGQESLDTASAHVNAIDADMGGTEVLPALHALLEREPATGIDREVVLLTDGEVSNEAAVIELAERYSARTRIFSFGIGSGASEYLVRSLARVTRGQAEFIHPGERIEPKVLRQFRRLGAPAVRDVNVQWQGADTMLQAPYRAPAVFRGEAAVLYARFHAGSVVAVTLSGNADGKPVSWRLPIEIPPGDVPEPPGAVQRGSLLSTLAARAAIRDLEEGTSALHDRARGSVQGARKDARVKKEIVALATAWRLASRETSFVAIERREGTTEQPAAELRRVPVALTHGWGGVERRDTGLRYCVHLSAPMMWPAAGIAPQRMRQNFSMLSEPDAAGESFPMESPTLSSPPPADIRSQASRARPARDARPHVDLAVLQRADGSWHLDGVLASALGVPLPALQAIARSIGRGEAARSIVATLAALRFLELRAWDARNEWQLLADKAERWLAKALAKPPAGTRADVARQVAALLP